MFRFKLGRIPVQVHASHLGVSAFFGISFLGGFTRQPGWPPGRLAEWGDWGVALAGLAVILGWMAIVFLTVLVHEAGRALAAQAFGYRSVIRLVWLGGHTLPEVPGRLPWNRDVAITAAGPGASLLLTGLTGLAYWALLPQATPPSLLDLFVENFFRANVLWTVLNLLPVMPLAGGRLSLQISMKLMGRRGLLASQLLAFAVCALIVVGGWRAKEPILVAIFALFAFQSIGLLQAWARGEGPLTPDEEPLEPELVEADAHLKAGRLADATRTAAEVLEKTTRPRTAGRAQLILGWAALKDGQGRRALDHFSQVSGHRIPPHALAGAFSLIGDEARALPLWEVAWQETHDRTVLHEWAGALIRAGRLERARRLPEVDLGLAATCAGRVLFLRGAYSEAAEIAEKSLQWAPRPEAAYEAACAHARSGNVERALRCLEQASQLGFVDADYASSDEDLDRLHGHPEFVAWLTRLPRSAAS